MVVSNSFDFGMVGFEFCIGGNKQFLLMVEVEFLIFMVINFKGVLFVDVGNVFGEGQFYMFVFDFVCFDINDYEDVLCMVVGFGFCWFSLIGLFRFEWGILFQCLCDEEFLVFEFSIGNVFQNVFVRIICG